MSTLAPVAESVSDLEQLVVLLDRASRQLWDHAGRVDQVDERLPLHSLGLAALMTQGHVVALLPEDHVIADDVLLASESEERSPLGLLVAAEEITRSPSLRHAGLPEFSQLVVDLCDLVREARGIDY